MGKGENAVWRASGVLLLVIGWLWTEWSRVVDFVGHLDAVPGLGGLKTALATMAGRYAVQHPNWLQDLGPAVVVACGLGLFMAPWLRPFLDRFLSRLDAARSLDEPGGWSVSIKAGQAMLAAVAPIPEAHMAFQQWRFVNISNARPRIIDVTITLPCRDGSGPAYVYRSNQSDKAQYQVKLEEAGKGNMPRRMGFITFPLTLAPSQMVDGQIAIDLPDVIKSSADLHDLIDAHAISFEFTEHISGRSVVLGFGETFDAHTGAVEKSLRSRALEPKRRSAFGRIKLIDKTEGSGRRLS